MKSSQLAIFEYRGGQNALNDGRRIVSTKILRPVNERRDIQLGAEIGMKYLPNLDFHLGLFR